MNGSEGPRYPRTAACKDGDVELRYMTSGDEAAVLAFARDLPTHDLLFLPRDISQPKVLSAWIGELERGAMTSILALRDGTVVGNATLVRDPLSWSPHVAELRLVVAPHMRGKGLGRILSEDASALALSQGVEKVIAQMTPDQRGAIEVFETMGYRAEALLRDHVKDRSGVKHDIVILSHDVETFNSRIDAYGLSAAFNDK